MRVACLVSGGKDSIFASLVAQDRGWDITHFVTLEPQADAPMLFHKPNLQWVPLQARCVGVPHVVAPAGEGDAAEVDALAAALAPLEVDGVVSGALASEYQRTRIDAVGERLGLKTFTPLWHHDPAQHLHDLVTAGVESIVVHVAAEGLGKEWLGRALDHDAVHELERLQQRYGLNAAGEGGEYETFVVDAPHFNHRIRIEESSGTWKRDTGTLEIRKATLGFKTAGPRVTMTG